MPILITMLVTVPIIALGTWLYLRRHKPATHPPKFLPRENWPYRVGLALLIMEGLVFMSGSPFALAIVTIASISCLLVGLFRYAVSDIGIIRFVLYTLITAFLIVVGGRALFIVVESLTYDTSADSCAGSVILTAWAGALAALIYGIVHRIRKRRGAYQDRCRQQPPRLAVDRL